MVPPGPTGLYIQTGGLDGVAPQTIGGVSVYGSVYPYQLFGEAGLVGVGSYFEFVTTLFAWVIYKEIWAVLVDTALVFVPLITMMVGNIVSSRRAGDDEGSAGLQSLKKIETDLYMMVGVIVFAAIPVLDVTLGEMTYVKPALDCRAPAAAPVVGTATGTTYDTTLTALGGKTGQAPIWWATLHTLSKAVVSASLAGIPCSNDLASVQFKLANETIEDPDLRKDLAEFTDHCYRPSRSKLLRSDTSTLTSAELKDTLWLGSNYFQTHGGYYDTYYAYNPNPDFAFNATRDSGFEADTAAGGHPNCNQWWSDSGHGIRIRVLDSIDPALLDEMVYTSGGLVSDATTSTLSTTERENVLLRKYLAVEQTKQALGLTLPMSTGYRVTSQDQFAAALASDGFIGKTKGYLSALNNFGRDVARTAVVGIGAAVKAPAAIGEGYMIRQGISMIQSLVLMLLVFLLPFLMLFSQYKISTVFTLSIIFFALHMLSFLWGVAYWMDNNLMHLMTEGTALGVFEPLANPVQSGIILWMERFLYIIFPMFFLTALGWVGIQAGQLGNQIQSFGSSVAAPGAAGGNVATSIATKGKG
jgi:hypothetical protein